MKITKPVMNMAETAMGVEMADPLKYNSYRILKIWKLIQTQTII